MFYNPFETRRSELASFSPGMASILIVDDDRATRVGVAELLEDAGYGVIAVATFEEAARILRSSPPDLLIADVRLGPFNGLQLVISSPTPVPAIIITGFADPVLESDARRRGAAYLLKPVQPSLLLDLVAAKLATKTSFGVPRRWERKQVVGGLPAEVSGEPARILDVSYGGLRFEIPGQAERTPPSSFRITFPTAQLSVQAELVWKSLVAGRTWLVGAALSEENKSMREWNGLVDALS
jgi:CheY-like chemotaxis protein